jgi:hypothetical protein
MMNVLKYSVVGLLLMTLIGGSIYILVRPNGAGARELGVGLSEGRGRDQRGEASVPLEYGYRGGGASITRQGRGRAQDDVVSGRAGIGHQGSAEGREQGRNEAWEAGEGPLAETESHLWETVQGVVVATGTELTVATSDGEVMVGMGQAAYLEGSGFAVAEGDEVFARGFWEDGEFKAGEVENLTTGASIVLRDLSGRPMWAGRGNGQNRR